MCIVNRLKKAVADYFFNYFTFIVVYIKKSIIFEYRNKITTFKK